MMSRKIRIKIHPNETVRFPGVCVHCLQPAVEMMTVRKRNGRVTREVDVPLCAGCARQLARQSGDEERMKKLERLLIGVAFMIVVVFVLLVTPSDAGIGVRLLLALPLAAVAAWGVHRLFQPTIRKAALPEKQAILSAAQLRDFSWRTTTFEFANEAFAERFSELNDSLLMEL